MDFDAAMKKPVTWKIFGSVAEDLLHPIFRK
jgi:hypothetical protein